jgi:hypothetical protein
VEGTFRKPLKPTASGRLEREARCFDPLGLALGAAAWPRARELGLEVKAAALTARGQDSEDAPLSRKAPDDVREMLEDLLLAEARALRQLTRAKRFRAERIE